MFAYWIRGLVFSSLVMSACGGRSSDSANSNRGTGGSGGAQTVTDAPGCVVKGIRYHFDIQSISDSCDPAAWSGDVGDTMGVARVCSNDPAQKIVNLPINELYQRQDFALATSLDFTTYPLPDCPTLRKQVIFNVNRVDDMQIEVTAISIFSSVQGCSLVGTAALPLGVVVPLADCRSERLLTYSWIRDCPTVDFSNCD